MHSSTCIQNHSRLLMTATAGLLLLIALVAFATTKKISPVSWGWFGPVNETSGLALRGYDAVSYHQGDPTLGQASNAFEWRGTRWHFASAENRAAFAGAPERYAPQSGGFCAFAVSKGLTADADPKQYHLHDGKLFLFDSAAVRAEWIAAIDRGVVQTTLANWARR